MESPTVPEKTPNELADDILRGADEIAAFIYGERGLRRKVYYLAECSKLPIFSAWICPVRAEVSPAGVYLGPGKPRKSFEG